LRGVASSIQPGSPAGGPAPSRRKLELVRSRLDCLFRPRSVALVGASSRVDAVGRQLLDNLLDFGYTGRLFPVNPKAEEIRGLRCYPSVGAIEEPVDVAVLVLPRASIVPLAEECLAAGARSLVVITGGFRELDAEGARLEAQLRDCVAKAGVPLLGPNCMGLFNADQSVRFNLTFSPVHPRPGHVAFLSQSGALAAQVLTQAPDLGLNFSLFASLGNEAGITHRDSLDYAGADPNTRVVVLYLETFDDPQAFIRIAREVTRRKPVICLKGGRTETGARAAGSHTGALATNRRAFEAAMRQSGVVMADTTEEMLNVALGFSRAALPRGRRVRVLTNAGGPGVLATDMLARHNLELPPLTSERRVQLRRVVTPQAPLGNPVDLTVEGTPKMYGDAARLLLKDKATDALLAVFVEPPRVAGPEVLQALREAAADTDKSVVFAFPAQGALRRQCPPGNFALIDYPEAAAAVLGALRSYAERKEQRPGRVRRFRVNRHRVMRLIQRARRQQRNALDTEESFAALRAYGIPLARYRLARTATEAARAAESIGFPVALKVVSPDILHKTEVGGVVLGIDSRRGLQQRCARLRQRLRSLGLEDKLRGFLVQKMAAAERELILGFRRDEQGTPLLLVGLGGILVEALDAVAVRVLPVTDQDVRDMLSQMPAASVLDSFREMQPVARTRLEESLLRLAQLAADFDEIAEIDLNPFVASARPAACEALDARIVFTS
jgi:acyl-CoA synthetase (NDP forming)